MQMYAVIKQKVATVTRCGGKVSSDFINTESDVNILSFVCLKVGLYQTSYVKRATVFFHAYKKY